ncbi:MAG: hypothetical protein ACHQIG_13755 [Acidimicrobiia bacterium]
MADELVIQRTGDTSAPARRRGRIAIYLVPMGIVVVIGQIAKAIWPSLLESAPAVLLAATSSMTRVLLVQPLVPAVVFFVIAIARILLLAPLYFSFGSEYGDAALRWGEQRLGGSSTMISKFERGFRRAGRPLVACWWSPIVAIMAGATGMRARVFFPLIVVGAVGRVSAIYFIGDWLAEPLTAISSFIGRYTLILTPLTIALTVFQIWYSRRRGRRLAIGTLEELEEDFAITEAAVAGEATVVSPPEPD